MSTAVVTGAGTSGGGRGTVLKEMGARERSLELPLGPGVGLLLPPAVLLT